MIGGRAKFAFALVALGAAGAIVLDDQTGNASAAPVPVTTYADGSVLMGMIRVEDAEAAVTQAGLLEASQAVDKAAAAAGDLADRKKPHTVQLAYVTDDAYGQPMRTATCWRRLLTNDCAGWFVSLGPRSRSMVAFALTERRKRTVSPRRKNSMWSSMPRRVKSSSCSASNKGHSISGCSVGSTSVGGRERIGGRSRELDPDPASACRRRRSHAWCPRP